MPTSPAVAANTLTNPKAESMVRALINEPRCGRDEELLMMPMATTSETCGGSGSGSMTEADDALDLFLPSPSGQPGILGDLAANGGASLPTRAFFPWSLGPQSMDLDDFYVMKPDDSDLGCFTTATAEGGHADALSTSPGQQLAPDAAAQEAAIAAVVDALQETHDWFARSGQAYDDGGVPSLLWARAGDDDDDDDDDDDAGAGAAQRASLGVELLPQHAPRLPAAAPRLFLGRGGRARAAAAGRSVLCGSLYSPPTDGALSCRGLFHLAEELAFRRLAAALAAAEEAADSAAAAGAAGGGGGGGGGGRAQGRLGGAEFVHTGTRIRIATWTPPRRRASRAACSNCPQSMTTLEMTGDLPCVPGRAVGRVRAGRVCARAVDANGGPASCLAARLLCPAWRVESLMADYDDNNNNNDNDDAGAASRFPLRHLALPDPARARLRHPRHPSAARASPTCATRQRALVIVRAVSRWQALWDRAARGGLTRPRS
ncbi:hypothetical protein RB597_005616 [Gaeumannomyces tritici]